MKMSNVQCQISNVKYLELVVLEIGSIGNSIDWRAIYG